MSVITRTTRSDAEPAHARIDAFLDTIGLGPLDPATVRIPRGRNDMRTGLAGNTRVFVKQIVGVIDHEVEARLDRVLAFEAFLAAAPAPLLRSPRMLGHDRSRRFLAFEEIPDERAGQAGHRALATFWTGADAARLGSLVADLHELGPGRTVPNTGAPPPMPPVALFAGLPQWMYERSSFGELEVWKLLQHDDELVAGLTALRAGSAAAPRVPTHGDLRFDQLIGPQDRPYLTDWEEFRLDDGARDVGSLAGDWLHAAIRDIITGSNGTSTAAEFLSHEEVLERGTAAIGGVRPDIERFWSAYRAGRGELDEGFADRLTAFTGWHLIDRLMATSQHSARLHGIDLAAAGIGRAMILQPARFAASVGFGGAS